MNIRLLKFKYCNIDRMINKLLVVVVLLLLSCQTVRKIPRSQDTKKIFNTSTTPPSYFVGFSLYDLTEKEFLIHINDDHYFTPASNTKIVTLAAYLNLNLERIPSFLINKDQHHANIIALGDPTFLHPDFKIQPAFDYLKSLQFDTLIFNPPLAPITHYGPGWAWDDYPFYFQAERSWMPLYGNALSFNKTKNGYQVIPDFFTAFVDFKSSKTTRSPNYNLFSLSNQVNRPDTLNVHLPFIIDTELIKNLLADTLPQAIVIGRSSELKPWTLIEGPEVTPVLTLMMDRSDNFLAEQLLVNGQRYKGFETIDEYINYLKITLFADLNDPLIWVDGSGLSRYNMITPRNLVRILEKIYEMTDWPTVTTLFPDNSDLMVAGPAESLPFLFAKTGTLRHNHCLSGYLITKSGKKLIFSFMNNHYTGPTSEISSEMYKILSQIRDKY